MNKPVEANSLTFLKIKILALSAVYGITLLVSGGCKSDNPLAPGKGAILQDYLPLQGNSQAYSFTLFYSSWHGPEYYYCHTINGICQIDIERGPDNASYYHLISTAIFNVELDSIFKQLYYPESEITVNKDYSISHSSDLFLSADSLWYEVDDSSASDAVTRRFAMNYSKDSGGSVLDLAPFLPPGWEIELFGHSPEIASNNSAETKGDTLIYTFDVWHSPAVIYEGTVKFLKGAGLFSIQYTRSEGEGTLSIARTTISYTKI